MSDEYNEGDNVKMNGVVEHVVGKDVAVEVTYGQGIKRHVIVSSEKVSIAESMRSSFVSGDKVSIAGIVTHIKMHNNGVLTLGVAFGKGSQRQVFVPAEIVQLIPPPVIAPMR